MSEFELFFCLIALGAVCGYLIVVGWSQSFKDKGGPYL